MKVSLIQYKLSKYPLDKLSQQHKFNRRSNAKVTLGNFIGSFFLSLSESHSLRRWAMHLSEFLPSGQRVSKAGLQKRLGSAQLSTIKAFLQQLINQRINSLHIKSASRHWFADFGQVLLEDSVCVKLNPQLFSAFQGAYNKMGQISTARIQVCLNLKNLCYQRFALMGYRDNDQKYSVQILKLLKAGDLLIRDLGYWSLEVFEQIVTRKAFLLTRYKPGVKIYPSADSLPWDLVQQLTAIHKRGGNFCDQTVYVGKSQRLRLRLVALRCPDSVIEKRIRKAKQNRHARANHGKAYYELLKWSIFLTNVDPQIWSADQVCQIYGFRWHIEMIFKVWKSKFGLQALMRKAQIKKPIHAQLFFFLFLSYLVLFYMAYFTYFLEKLHQKHQKILSLFKFADFFTCNFLALLQAQQAQTLEQFIPCLLLEACQETRARRPSQLEFIFQLKVPPKIELELPRHSK